MPSWVLDFNKPDAIYLLLVFTSILSHNSPSHVLERLWTRRGRVEGHVHNNGFAWLNGSFTGERWRCKDAHRDDGVRKGRAEHTGDKRG